MREASLYLPKDRRVILRIVPANGVVRMDPLHRGELSVPCGTGRPRISADVLGPKRFRAQLEALDTAEADRGAGPS
jgi:hypothetical protein